METQDNVIAEFDKEIELLEHLLSTLKESRKYFVSKRKSLTHISKTLNHSFKVSPVVNSNGKFAPSIRDIIRNNDCWFTTNDIVEILKERYPSRVANETELTKFKNNISYVLSESKKKKKLGIGSIEFGGSGKKNYWWGKSEWIDSNGKPKANYLFNLPEVKKEED